MCSTPDENTVIKGDARFLLLWVVPVEAGTFQSCSSFLKLLVQKLKTAANAERLLLSPSPIRTHKICCRIVYCKR